jgi:small subunit ribosomal protein S8
MTMTDPIADLLTRIRNGNQAYHDEIVTLKYGPQRERSIAGIRRISKPGLRVYAKSTHLPKVLGGLGVAIISTSQGLLTDRQANKKGVGGEVLAYVW